MQASPGRPAPIPTTHRDSERIVMTRKQILIGVLVAAVVALVVVLIVVYGGGGSSGSGGGTGG